MINGHPLVFSAANPIWEQAIVVVASHLYSLYPQTAARHWFLWVSPHFASVRYLSDRSQLAVPRIQCCNLYGSTYPHKSPECSSTICIGFGRNDIGYLYFGCSTTEFSSDDEKSQVAWASEIQGSSSTCSNSGGKLLYRWRWRSEWERWYWGAWLEDKTNSKSGTRISFCAYKSWYQNSKWNKPSNQAWPVWVCIGRYNNRCRRSLFLGE